MMNRILEYVTGPTFQSRLSLVTDQTGWRPVSRNSKLAAFSLTYGGHEYELFAEPRGDSVILTAASNGRYARRQFPPVLEQVLLRRNRELEKFDWQLFHGSSSSWAVLICSVKLAAWDGDLMRFATNRMLAEVELLDDGMREHGLMS